MARYIDADGLMERIQDKRIRNKKLGKRLSVLKVIRFIETSDACDVAHVVHGRWVRVKNRTPGNAEAVCSICGREVVYQVVGGKYVFENGCPHCHARMDLE